jgi:hypothetical protein
MATRILTRMYPPFWIAQGFLQWRRVRSAVHDQGRIARRDKT